LACGSGEGQRRVRDSRHGGRPRLGKARVGAGPGAGGAGGIRGTRVEGERGTATRDWKGAIELSWTVLKTRVIY
jgi:hypothetical protein